MERFHLKDDLRRDHQICMGLQWELLSFTSLAGHIMGFWMETTAYRQGSVLKTSQLCDGKRRENGTLWPSPGGKCENFVDKAGMEY